LQRDGDDDEGDAARCSRRKACDPAGDGAHALERRWPNLVLVHLPLHAGFA
jgi:hypothetical protein